MNREWPTEQHDLQLAEQLIEKYEHMYDDDPLCFYLVSDGEGAAQIICNHDWLEELNELFVNEYGRQTGEDIASRVVTRIVLEDEVLH